MKPLTCGPSYVQPWSRTATPPAGARVRTTVPVGGRQPGLVGTVLEQRPLDGCDVLVQLDRLDKPLGFTRFELKVLPNEEAGRAV